MCREVTCTSLEDARAVLVCGEEANVYKKGDPLYVHIPPEGDTARPYALQQLEQLFKDVQKEAAA